MAETAVVILNWNGADHLRTFLGKVVECTGYPGTRIYVADNGSTDDSVKWIEKNQPEVSIIKLDKNYGFAGGYNKVLEQINSDFFVLLNSDIEVTPGWLGPLIEHMKSNPDTAACQPKILSYHNPDKFEYAGAAGGFIDKFGYPFCRGRIFDKTETDSGQYDSDLDIFWASGACMVIRSALWKQSGGFDADFFAHMEEIDLCWRLSRAGHRVRYVHSSVVYHVGGGALSYGSPFKTYLNFRNNLFLLYKNLPQKTFHRTLFLRKILDGISAAMFLLTGKFALTGAVWKAHMDYYRAVPELKIKRNNIKKTSITEYSDTILNKSVVFEFYVKGKKTFDKLKMNFNKI
jgi:GT2 family glycosyltransferase